MPATSRKRNKGKDRKAKKLEKDRVRINQLWRGWIRGDPHKGTTIQCHHGLVIEPMSDSHPVSIFMDAFLTHWYDRKMGVLEILQYMFPSHCQVYISDEYRNMVIKIFTRIGTNMILTAEDCSTYNTANFREFAKVITTLEQYTGTGDIIVSIFGRIAVSKAGDLDSSIRDAIKFYRKRTTCKCLKKLHLESRKFIPKMGTCSGCEKEALRATLSVCSRCMITQYCSRECQVSNWPEHERDCCIFVNAHNALLEASR